MVLLFSTLMTIDCWSGVYFKNMHTCTGFHILKWDYLKHSTSNNPPFTIRSMIILLPSHTWQLCSFPHLVSGSTSYIPTQTPALTDSVSPLNMPLLHYHQHSKHHTVPPLSLHLRFLSISSIFLSSCSNVLLILIFLIQIWTMLERLHLVSLQISLLMLIEIMLTTFLLQLL